MGGINDRLVAQATNLAKRIEEETRNLALPIRIEIGSANITDKQCVTGKYADNPNML